MKPLHPIEHAGGGASDGARARGRNLDSYLAAPKTLAPNNRMSFPGLHAAGDRADLIAFLATQK